MMVLMRTTDGKMTKATHTISPQELLNRISQGNCPICDRTLDEGTVVQERLGKEILPIHESHINYKREI